MAGYLTTKGKVILANGYNIIPIKPGEKRPSLKKWQSSTFTEKDLNRWISNGRADHGLGIPTKWTPFVDVDIQDTSMVAYMRDQIEMTAGYAPVRIGAAPKFGMVFRVDVPFPKISSKEFRDPDGRRAQVEILGDGEQFVAWHIHPDTKKPYRWIGSDSPENTPAADLPLLTQEKARQLIKAFEDEAERRGWTHAQRSRLPVPAQTPGWVDDLDDIGPDGTEQLGLTDDELRAKVALIPNDDVPYEGMGLTWFNMLAAIHHETDGSEEGREIALEWSEKSGKHESARFTKTWESFGKGERRPVTARLIIQEAKAYEKVAQEAEIVDLLQQMDFAADVDELRTIAAKCRAVETDLIDRSRLANAMQKAMRRMTTVAMGIREAREMVRYRPEEGSCPDWLAGWCYLKHARQFYHQESGERINREAFDAAFGRYVGTETSASRYAMDTIKIPTYHMTIYLPTESEEFQDPAGLRWINTYTEKWLPIIPNELTKRDRENVQIIANHARHLFGDNERDIGIFHSWIAHIVQTKRRPNWAIVLQGAEGTGKSFYADLFAAILGSNNVYTLGAETVRSDFTAWAEGKLLIFVEEPRQHGHNRFDMPNRMKTYISNGTVEVHKKGIDPYNVPNTAAYMFATNYRDALPLDGGDSRYFVLMSRFQRKEEIDQFKRDNPNYYPRLWKALAESPGAIRQWFMNYELHPEFNHSDRAPPSRGRDDMIEESKPEEHRIIEELIAEKRHPLVSEDLIVVHVLKELTMDEYGELSGRMASPVGIRRLLTGMGYRSTRRFRIGEERFSCWTTNHGLTEADAETLRKLIFVRYEDLKPL